MDSNDDVAKSMIRMYGGRAEMVAIEHVNNSRREGDAQSYERWLRIAGQIRVISGQIKS
jgi:hypothetical protein